MLCTNKIGEFLSFRFAVRVCVSNKNVFEAYGTHPKGVI